jgi:hypothetical protein
VPGLAEYTNVPAAVSAVISARLATLHECDTIYSVEDIYLMLEIVSVDTFNKNVVTEYVRRKEH